MSSPTMMPMSLTEIAQAVDGRLMPTTVPTDEPVAISAFTDSRQIVPGSVFVAIAGERVDGHVFRCRRSARRGLWPHWSTTKSRARRCRRSS